MSITSALLSFAAVAGLVTVFPGPDTIMVLQSALIRGWRSALATATGILCGLLIWAVVSAAGASVLVTASESAYTALRIVGAVYVAWLGGRMVWSALRRPSEPARDSAVQAEAPQPSAGSDPLPSAWRRGLLTNLLNPKVGAFYVAMLPQFIPDHTSHLAFGVLLALVHATEGLLWFALVISCAHQARAVLGRLSVRRAISCLAGTALVGFGLRLGLSSR